MKEKLEKIRKRNDKFIKQFDKWLIEKGLTSKTIRNHITNVDLFLNNYLLYYSDSPMEEGYFQLDDFMSDWFVRKCMWSTASSMKTTAASLKKFYQCMYELNNIPKETYITVCEIIKEEMESWIDSVELYNDFDEGFFF